MNKKRNAAKRLFQEDREPEVGLFEGKPKPTGYSVYQPEFERRFQQNTLADLYPPLPSEKFDIIYADPPWHYSGKMQFDRRSTGKETIDLSKNIFISSACF